MLIRPSPRALNQKFTGQRPGTLMLSDDQLAQTIAIVESRYAAKPLRSWCNGHLRYGRLAAGPAYLRIENVLRLREGRGFEADHQTRARRSSRSATLDRATAVRRPSVRRTRYRGPIVELIGPDTVSAGETFTMALMGRRPHVLRIGGNTQGVYSDVLVRHLPNGWRFWLPNEAFVTEQEGTSSPAARAPPPSRRRRSSASAPRARCSPR